MDNYRVLIAGAGFWGKRWIEHVQAHERLELAAVVGRTQPPLGDAANQYSLDKGILHSDLDRALGSAKADIVVVVTPPPCHLEHVRTAIQAGCHVICEKPLADTWDAAVQTAEAVRSRPDRKFMVSQTRRYTDQIQAVRQAIASGMIGQIDTISFDHRVNFTGGGFKQEMDNPVLEDMICHHLDAFRYLSGQEPVSVYAEGWNPAWSQFSGKASNNVLVTMTGGVHVNYFGTWTARGQLNDYDGIMKIMGSDGSLDLPVRDTLLHYAYTGQETSPTPDPKRIPIAPLADREIDGIIDAFLTALDTDAQPPCHIDDNLRTFAFNCAVLTSWREGRRVELAEFPTSDS